MAALAPPGPLVVITYNIHHGENLAREYRLEAIADVIVTQAPDLVALQEVDRGWGPRSALENQPDRLASLTGLHACYAPALERPSPTSAETSGPAPAAAAGHLAQYGNLVLSRVPPRECHAWLLPKVGDAVEQRAVAEMVVDWGAMTIRFCSTHLQFGSSEERVPQVASLLERVTAGPALTIVAGDLNVRPDASELRPLFNALTDAWAAGGDPFAGSGDTVPAASPHARIDYLLVDPAFTVQRTWVPATLASDHRPVVTWLTLR